MIINPSRCLLCFLLWLWPLWAVSAAKGGPGVDIDEAEFLLLELEIQRLLVADFDGYLYREELYLPATQFFSILKLPHTYRPDETLLEIQHPKSDKTVRIDLKKNLVREFPEEVTSITDEDYILDTNEVYLRREWVEQAFGFSLIFDYRRLKLMLFSEEELPVIRDYRRKQLYETFEKETQTIRPDVIQPAGRHLFNGWIANWSLSSSHNLYRQDYAYGLALGGHLLGGDMTVHSSGSRQYGIRWEQIRGQWRFPFYNSAIVQQTVVGDQSQPDVLGGSHMTYRGLAITNRPKKPRREFDTYRLSRYLEKGWDAEIYVNNRLADIAVGSRQDSLDFTLPLRYGSNRFTLKYYNPDNEDYEQTFHFQIPQNFLPRGSVEYDVTAGRYRNFEEQIFANGQLKWGASSSITLGGGLRFHPEAPGSEKYVPFMQTWLRLGSRLIIEGSHAYNHRSGGTLNYTFPNTRRLRLSVEKYHQTSVYNKLGKSLEVSANTSFPLNLPFLKLSAFTSGRYTESQSSRFANLYGGISSFLPAGIQARVNSRLSFRGLGGDALQQIQHITELQFSKRLLRQYLLRPSFQYDHSQQQIMQSRIEISRRVFSNGYLSFSMQHDHRIRQSSFYLRFTLNLPYARHSSYVSTTQTHPTFNQSTSGTVALDRNKNMYTDRRNWIGKAVARIDPFLDLNDNDRRDKGEPLIDGLRADFYESPRTWSPVRRGQQVAENLTPYESYLVRVDGSSLDNPLWIPKYENYQVQVSPNLINSIPVPILVSGEMAGTVRMRSGGNSRMSNLNVYVSDADNNVRDTLRTYTNGSFFKIGLKPGRYTASLDRSQLAERSYYAVKDSIEFVIEPTQQGDIVEGIDLEVISRASSIQDPAKESKIYAIQIGAFRDKENAVDFGDRISKLTGYTTSVMYDRESQLYKSRLGQFSSPEAAWEQFDLLQKNYPGVFTWSFVIDLEDDELNTE